MNAAKDESLKIIQNLNREFELIVQLFNVITRSPDVVTPQLLEKARLKMQSIFRQLKDVEGKITDIDKEVVQEIREELGKLPAVMLLDDVIHEFEDKMDVSLALSNDEIGVLRVHDNEFQAMLRTLLEASLQSQKGIQRKNCEIAVGSAGDSMILKFKDFTRSIPEEDIPRFFHGEDGSGRSGGYSMYRLKRKVQQLGGDVEVDSGRARFTVFTIKLPYAA